VSHKNVNKRFRYDTLEKQASKQAKRIRRIEKFNRRTRASSNWSLNSFSWVSAAARSFTACAACSLRRLISSTISSRRTVPFRRFKGGDPPSSTPTATVEGVVERAFSNPTAACFAEDFLRRFLVFLAPDRALLIFQELVPTQKATGYAIGRGAGKSS
jgi:hypothetical protein